MAARHHALQERLFLIQKAVQSLIEGVAAEKEVFRSHDVNLSSHRCSARDRVSTLKLNLTGVSSTQPISETEHIMKIKALLSFLFLILALGACSSDSPETSEEAAAEVADELDY